MAPQQPITVTLEAQHWDVVMRAMAKAPYEIVAPLIQAIQQQCMQQDDARPVMRGNGPAADEHPGV